MTESVIQTQIVAWLSLVARRYEFLFASVPNEGMMTAALMGSLPKSALFGMLTKFKKMGMTPGFSDLVIGWQGRMFCMEVKTFDVEGKPTQLRDNQRTFAAWCASCGIPYRVVRSLDEAQRVMVEWGIIQRRPSDG
jgi:hypothetical protein